MSADVKKTSMKQEKKKIWWLILQIFIQESHSKFEIQCK